MKKILKTSSPRLSLVVQYVDPRLQTTLSRGRLRRWVQISLFHPAEITLRFVDAIEARFLNLQYRGKNKPTNVLTFSYEQKPVVLADIALCTDIIYEEAERLKISVLAHAAHLVVHGVLHAQGFDHENTADAVKMEALEIGLLQRLGFSSPY